MLAGDQVRLQALNWTASGYERQVLLMQPATCLDPAAPRETMVGEALFNAPALLGGQAERAGLSCAGCHANGRRSAGFYLEGISRESGTADITSSFFALPRANSAFDPRPIPDLALPGAVARRRDVLEPFLRGLIVEEFSGAEPGPAALAALSAYVGALRACPGAETEPKTIDGDLRLVTGSVDAAGAMIAGGERGSAAVLVKAARFRLGRIEERMAGRRLEPVRKQLAAASRQLAAAEGNREQLGIWRQRFERGLGPVLIRNRSRSLYDPGQVDRWLAKRR